jgi:glyoxylase-like metal-dependent hydrolase (beta-lactamase superfamily II)
MVERVPVTVPTRAEAGTTNAYLVGTDPSVLVDPAAPTEALDDAVAKRSVEHLVVTHTHEDHVGAVARYADEATVWARAGYEDRFREATGVDPDASLREGTVVATTDEGEVGAIDTPGHAPDHVGLSVGGSLLVGDLVVAEGSVVVGSDEGDLRSYLTSLRRLYARNPDRLYPGHGPVIEDARPEIHRLIRHRLGREQRILVAVHAGARTVEEVVDGVYDKDITGVRDLARSTVEAHLAKLAVEGRVRWDGERAHPQ